MVVLSKPSMMVASRPRPAHRGVLQALAVRAVESANLSVKAKGLLAVMVAAVLWFFRRLSQMGPRRGKMAPGPKHSIFSPLGHAMTILNRYPDLPDYYVELKKQYGYTIRLVVGPPISPLDNILICNHPDSLRHFLKDNFDNYIKGDDLIAYMQEVFGKSIFASNGQSWYHQRKTSSQIFTGNNIMNEMVKIMLNNSEKLVQAMKDLSAGGTKPVDIQNLFLAFTMDSFCEIGFGMSIGSLAAEPPPKWKKFVEYWDELQFLCPERAFHPEYVAQKALAGLARKGLPVGFLCKQEMRIYEMDKYVNECIDEVIAERIRNGPMTKHAVAAEQEAQAAEGSPSSPTASSPKGSSPKGSPKASRRNSSSTDETKRLDAVELFMSVKPPMSPRELRDVVKGLILGGRDTTGVTIMWTFYEIGCNKDVEAKLMEEVKDLPVDDPVAFYNALKGCKLIDAVVRETIRLHSPVPIDAKKAVNDDVLPDGTFVGAGWIVTYSPYVMARDTELWGPDAEVWRPARWFEGSLAKGEPSPFVYPFFQAGPRICLGKDLALLEAKSCVALMMRAGVQMRLWPGAPPPKYKMGMTLAVDENGMPMEVTFKD